MDYNQKFCPKFIDKACGLASTPRSWAKTVGDYDRVGTQVVPRDSMLTRIVTQYSQRKWPGTVAVYLLSMLDLNQQIMLASGPFGEEAVTDWSFVPGHTKISEPFRGTERAIPGMQLNQLGRNLQFKIRLLGKEQNLACMIFAAVKSCIPSGLRQTNISPHGRFHWPVQTRASYSSC